MWPGYVDHPYHSPILIRSAVPQRSGNGRLDITFLNPAYATGVQEMTYHLTVFMRQRDYLLAAVIETDRAIAIVPLMDEWFATHMPGQNLAWRESAKQLQRNG